MTTMTSFNTPFALRHKKLQSQRRSAFTLVEILLVVVIIGILAAVALTQLDIKGQSDFARETATRTDAGRLQSGVQQYYMRKAKMPSSLSNLVEMKIFKKVPKDAWGGEFSLKSDGTVFAKTPDGKEITAENGGE